MFVLKTIKIIILIIIFLFFSPIIRADEIFLSLKKNKVNVRYGPSFDSKIKYVYNKLNLPVKQIDQKENFLRIENLKNNIGWIIVSHLKN